MALVGHTQAAVDHGCITALLSQTLQKESNAKPVLRPKRVLYGLFESIKNCAVIFDRQGFKVTLEAVFSHAKLAQCFAKCLLL